MKNSLSFCFENAYTKLVTLQIERSNHMDVLFGFFSTNLLED